VTPVGSHRADANAASDPAAMFLGIQHEDLAKPTMPVMAIVNRANCRKVWDQIGRIGPRGVRAPTVSVPGPPDSPWTDNFKRQYNEMVFESARASCHSFHLFALHAADGVHCGILTKSEICREVFRRPPPGHTVN
jgi:hypothetical protein